MRSLLAVTIQLNGTEILAKETSRLFEIMAGMSLQQRKAFVLFLESPFFGVKQPLVLAELFKKLYQRYAKRSLDVATLSCNGKTLLLREPNERKLSYAKQVSILSNRINALVDELGRFSQHEALLNVKEDYFLPNKVGPTVPLSAKGYDTAINETKAQPCSPPRLMEELRLRYEQYFVTGNLPGKEAATRLATIKTTLATVNSMIATIGEIEEINYRNSYGAPPLSIIEPGDDEMTWMIAFGKLLELWRAAGTFDWAAYEQCKQLIQDNHQRFSKVNQLLYCQYVTNYLVKGLKAGELGLEAEEFFWANFRLKNELVTVGSGLSDLTYLNFVSLLSAGDDPAPLNEFRRVYLPLVERKRKDVKWMSDIIVAFSRGKYGQVLERLSVPETGSRNAELQYTTRKFSLRLRAILATELLDIEHGLEDDDFANFRQASKSFSTHLSDARLAEKSRYPDWYIEANQQVVTICSLIRNAHRELRFEDSYEGLVEAVNDRTYLPRRQWFLDLLERVKIKKA